MAQFIEWIQMLIVQYPSFEYLIIFLGTIIGGEVALFLVGFLIAQKVLSLLPAIIIGSIGAFLPNLLWYGVGRMKILDKTSEAGHVNTTFQVITETVQRVSRGNHLLALIFIKFLIGTPPILIMYINKTAMTLKKFFYYQSIAIFVSVCIIMSAGYVSGRGLYYVSEVFNNIYTTIGFILLVVFAIVAFQIWFEKSFIGNKK